MKSNFTDKDKQEIQDTILRIKKYAIYRSELMELDKYEGECVDITTYNLLLTTASIMDDLLKYKHYPQNFILLKLYEALIHFDITTIRIHLRDYNKILTEYKSKI